MDGDDADSAAVYDTDWSSLAQRSTPNDSHQYFASWGDAAPSPAALAPAEASVTDRQVCPLWKGDAFVPVGLHRHDRHKCYRNGMLQVLMTCDQFGNGITDHDESVISVFYSPPTTCTARR